MNHRKSLATALALIIGLAQAPVLAGAAPADGAPTRTRSSLFSAQPQLAETTLPSTSTFMETTAYSLNFRSGPSASSARIGSLPRGSIVELRSKYSPSWYQISYGGKTGYVASKYLKDTTVARTGDLYQTTGSVNFRTGPSTAYAVIRKLSAGTRVELIAKYSSTWYKVSVDGTIGYLSASYLTPLASAPQPTTGTAYVTTSSVNFRTGPSTAYAIIRKLASGTSVTLIAKYSSTWYKVNVGGTTGYLSASYLRLAESASAPAAIPTHSIGYQGGLHKKIADLRPYLDPSWNGHNYMSGPALQVYLDKGLLVTWGPALYNYDNKTTMILGHGSGVFNYMIDVKVGSLVSVSDLNGKVRTYRITDVKSNPNSDFYLRFNNGVSLADIYSNGGIEEAISLQMCQGSVNTHYYGVPVN